MSILRLIITTLKPDVVVCFLCSIYFIYLYLIGILPAVDQQVRPGDGDLVADAPRC